MTQRAPTTVIWSTILALLVPGPLLAQSLPYGGMSSVPQNFAEQEPLPADFESGVSFLDSAVPRSNVRLRFDVNQFNHRPTRAEFHFPADAFRIPETRVHAQELNTYVEYGLNEWFSTFMETPFKWINPEQNRNENGVGDFHFGAKFAGWNSETLLTAFQLRFGANTSSRALTGTGHWSVEPALLVNWRLHPLFTLEAQAGYWVPLGGTDYAGEVLKYGIGLSYGGRTESAIQVMPVAELVGWTITSGQELVPVAPGLFATESSAGETILNGCLGVRFTLGCSADLYAGYARCFSGSSWYRDMMRLEFRIFY